MKTPNFRHLATLVILICLSGCTSGQSHFVPDTLRINIAAEPPSLDSAITTDSTSFDVISNMMVGLTEYTQALKCAPACASSWEILNHGTVYRFHIRPNIRWSDGKPLTAYDFEYAWKRLLNPQTGAQYAYLLYDVKNAEAYNSGAIKDPNSLGISCPDPQTFVVELGRPAQYFIYLTAFCPTVPQRKDVIERWGTHWTDPEHIVCNGPFKLAKWAHEYKIELTANQNYYEGKQHLQAIRMFMIPEQSTAFALYENDQLDFVDNRSFSTPDVERCKNSPQYQQLPLLRGNYLGFNVQKKPFDSVLVRRAFTEALDRNVFPRILRRGERPQYTWIPPGLLGYNADSGARFDPDEARRLLAQAGYPDGKGFPRVELLYPNREDAKLVVESIQNQLKGKLKVNIVLVNQEWRVYLETLHRDPPAVFRASWGADYPDPETFMNLFTTHNGNNYDRFSDPKYDELLEKARSEQNEELRGQLYQQADAYLCKVQVPIAATFLSTQNVMVKPWVHGIKLNALDLQFFKNVTVGE
jgi:oligopeptide transport system substrate-binding protein